MKHYILSLLGQGGSRLSHLVLPRQDTEARQSEELHSFPLASSSAHSIVRRKAEGNTQKPQKVLRTIREQGSHPHDPCLEGIVGKTCQTARAVCGISHQACERMGGAEVPAYAAEKQ